ncbi:hypothetical protein GCM10022403_055850 [Streptomyces coacervatus]|uniref:Uncharacterized protein n=1 Tax=Streptomyces coacervatus TaxID=647381 RepID=A0ABP7ICM1_9ACTN
MGLAVPGGSAPRPPVGLKGLVLKRRTGWMQPTGGEDVPPYAPSSSVIAARSRNVVIRRWNASAQ